MSGSCYQILGQKLASQKAAVFGCSLRLIDIRHFISRSIRFGFNLINKWLSEMKLSFFVNHPVMKLSVFVDFQEQYI